MCKMVPAIRGFCAMIPAFALAAGVSLAQPLHAAEQNGDLTVLHLAQTAERAIPRDRLRVQLRAEATGSDARRVQADINRAMNTALEHAKATAGIKVESSGYSVYEDRQTNAPTRWHGTQGLTLVGSDFAAVLGLAGDLQGQGLAMSGLNFELAPETAHAAEDELTSEALQRLRRRAERVAADLQLTVVRLSNVRVGNVSGERPPVPFMGKAMGANAAPMPPPAAEAGDATVQVSVDADVLLGPSDHSRP